jgi:hypothetical protein
MSGYLPLATNLWEKHFHMTELKEIMRQRDSRDFANLLNRLREGQQTKHDIDVLKQRTSNGDCYSNLPHLFIKNEDVNSHNNAIFNEATSTKFTATSKDRVLTAHSPTVCKKNSAVLKDLWKRYWTVTPYYQYSRGTAVRAYSKY